MKTISVPFHIKRLLVSARQLIRTIWATKAYWLRAFFCWIVGAALLFNEENTNYDTRFHLRGEKSADSRIVIIDIPEREWVELHSETRNMLRPLKEVTNLTDSFFWNEETWTQLLSAVLKYEPAAVGITFFFGDNIASPDLSDSQRKIFEDSRMVWAAELDDGGRVRVPRFATSYNRNVGVKNIHADNDGLIRRVSSPLVQIPHFSARLAQVSGIEEGNSNFKLSRDHSTRLINYAGTGRSFKVIPFQEVMMNQISPEDLKGKIVIIGTGVLTMGSSASDQLLTPLGRMSRAEVLANITDNTIGGKWVERFRHGFYLIFLGIVVLIALYIIASYPQQIALMFFLWIATLVASISAWLFDSAYYWFPVLSPLLVMALTYVVFLSYQVAFNERKSWRLEQEAIYHAQIEQLKNNFVSMMSHDLKTPIAKIQAIVDRLLSQTPDDSLSTDLKNLRRSSDDLHKYIQSILQVTKVEAKEFKIRKEVTDLNENIERVVAHLVPLAQEKQIRIESHLEPMFSVELDTTLIQEVILNLVENAIKYTPPGGQVTVTSQEKDDNVFFIVQDTGPGIPPDEQTQIWGKFTRGSQVLTETGGSGLGLYLVKYFIELHGGQVFLESTLGQGTKIGFSIPIAEEAST